MAVNFNVFQRVRGGVAEFLRNSVTKFGGRFFPQLPFLGLRTVSLQRFNAEGQQLDSDYAEKE